MIGSSTKVKREMSTENPIGFTLKMINGLEMLQMAGIHRTALTKPLKCHESLLASLAGNAFSSFSCGPIYGAAVPLLPLTAEQLGVMTKVVEVEDSDSSQDTDEDDSSSSD